MCKPGALLTRSLSKSSKTHPAHHPICAHTSPLPPKISQIPKTVFTPFPPTTYAQVSPPKQHQSMRTNPSGRPSMEAGFFCPASQPTKGRHQPCDSQSTTSPPSTPPPRCPGSPSRVPREGHTQSVTQRCPQSPPPLSPPPGLRGRWPRSGRRGSSPLLPIPLAPPHLPPPPGLRGRCLHSRRRGSHPLPPPNPKPNPSSSKSPPPPSAPPTTSTNSRPPSTPNSLPPNPTT